MPATWSTKDIHYIQSPNDTNSRSQWPRGLKRGSAAACFLRYWVPILPGAWVFVSCVCCVLSVRGLCEDSITLPEEYCWVVCLNVIEGPHRGGPDPLGLLSHEKKNLLRRLHTVYRHFILHRYKLFIDHIFVKCLSFTLVSDCTSFSPKTILKQSLCIGRFSAVLRKRQNNSRFRTE